MDKEIKKIFVLAGGDDQISLIKELRLRFVGAEIILIDKAFRTLASNHADRHLIMSTLDQDEVLKVAIEEKIDLIVTACGDQTLPTMAYVSEKMGLNCYLTYQQSINLTNKLYMKRLMIENNIPTSNFILINDDHDISSIKLKFPVVVKPVDNNGSKGIIMVQEKENLNKAIENALHFTRTKNVIIEEFKSGEEYSIEAFIQNGNVTLLIVTKLIKVKNVTGKFTILKCTYPCQLSNNVEEKIESIISKIGIAFGIDNVPLMIQLIVENDEVNVVEFSARTGGGSKHHFIRELTSINIFQNLFDITFGLTPQIKVLKKDVYASINYIYSKPGEFSGILNFDYLKHQGILFDYYFYKLIGSQIEKSDVSSDRPAGFFIMAESEDELDRKTQIVDQTVKVLNEKYEDIMIHGIYNERE